jgi:Tol biopolymer transport system component
LARTTATRLLGVIFALLLASVALGGISASAPPARAGANNYWILLTSNRDGSERTYSVDADSSRLSPLLPSSPRLTLAAVSHDGGAIAYTGSRSSIYISRADGTGLRLLARSSTGTAAFSPDDRLIAFTKKDGIWIVGTNGRGLRRLTKGHGGEALGWSPNGKAIVYATQKRENGPITIAAQPLRGRLRLLVRTGPNEEAMASPYEYEPTWSPDGRWIAYVNQEDNERENGLTLVRPNGKGRHRVVIFEGGCPCDIDWWAWSPDGRWIAYEDGAELDYIQPSARWHKIAAHVAGPVAWSHDGRTMAIPVYYNVAGNKDVVGADVAVAGADGRGLRRLQLGLDHVSNLTWSPDSRSIAFAGDGQIWVVGSDGMGVRRLTNEGENDVVGWTRLAPVLPPAPPLPATEHVIGTNTIATDKPVAALSADGPNVAFVPQATKTDCFHVAVWTPGDDSTRRLGRLRAPCRGEGPQISEFALAGSSAAWVFADDYGCDPCSYLLESATLAEPSPLDVADCLGCAKTADFEGFHLHGHADLLVFNVGSLVRIGAGRETCPGTFSTATICSTLRRGADASPVDSVSGGLIAIHKPGAVTVLDEKGTLVRVFPFTPADVSAARLDGARLLVWRFGALELYDVATGARELSRPMPTGYRLADVDGGIAVLRQGDTIMLQRLGDGRSLTLTPGGGSVLADLEPAGLYYSYAPADGGGRVVFVPRAEVVRQLEGTS